MQRTQNNYARRTPAHAPPPHLAIYAAGPDERRVQGLDPVGGHDHLHVPHGVEAVQLVEQLEHGALNLSLAARVRVVALRADRVDLVCGWGVMEQKGSGKACVGGVGCASEHGERMTEALCVLSYTI